MKVEANLLERIQDIKDYVTFEDCTSTIWPWAVPAETILQDGEKLKELAQSLPYDDEYGFDTDDLCFALDRIFGVNPALIPRQTEAGPDMRMV